MEVLTGRRSNLILEGEPDWSVSAVYKTGENGSERPMEVEEVTGGYSITLPYFVDEVDLIVIWTISIPGQETIERRQRIEMATSLLTLTEVKSIIDQDEPSSVSDEDALKAERAARLIIQSHTGQTFGRYKGAISVTGSGEPYLRLPRRLIELRSINDHSFWKESVVVRGDGWFIRQRTYGVPTVKADFHGYNELSGPIVGPYSDSHHTRFTNNYEYEVNGTWGWDEIPEAVREAGRLLINDYACQDSMYRDRFLESVTSADWKIQFNKGAYTSTGNARANQLLSGYVLHRGWMVV